MPKILTAVLQPILVALGSYVAALAAAHLPGLPPLDPTMVTAVAVTGAGLVATQLGLLLKRIGADTDDVAKLRNALAANPLLQPLFVAAGGAATAWANANLPGLPQLAPADVTALFIAGAAAAAAQAGVLAHLLHPRPAPQLAVGAVGTRLTAEPVKVRIDTQLLDEQLARLAAGTRAMADTAQTHAETFAEALERLPNEAAGDPGERVQTVHDDAIPGYPPGADYGTRAAHDRLAQLSDKAKREMPGAELQALLRLANLTRHELDRMSLDDLNALRRTAGLDEIPF